MSSLADTFHRTLLEFIDELAIILPEESKLNMIRCMVILCPQQPLLDRFVKYILPYKPFIVAHDDRFFLEQADQLFGDNTDVQHFRHIWAGKDLHPDDRTLIWQWFEHLIEIVETPETD